MIYKIDGKPVRRFLWVREIRILTMGGVQNHAVEVEAFDKDHAMLRLTDTFGSDSRKSWEFVCELQDEETAGMLAQQLKLRPC